MQDAERELHHNRSLGTDVSDAHLAYLEERVQEQQGQIYVAESQEEVVGFVACFVEKLDAGDLHVVESAREYGYISDLYVVSSMRRAGVAAALMETAEQHFLALNLNVVRVGLLSRNEPAAQFYRKIGYEPYEFLYEKQLQK